MAKVGVLSQKAADYSPNCSAPSLGNPWKHALEVQSPILTHGSTYSVLLFERLCLLVSVRVEAALSTVPHG
jgi:hypothetical protein